MPGYDGIRQNSFQRRRPVVDKILIAGVDNSSYNRISTYFKQSQFDIRRHSGTESLDACVADAYPAIAILGTQRGQMDGLLEQVRRMKSARRSLPIFLISRFSSEDCAIEAFRAGVDDYFKPPIQYERLCRRIRQVLGGESDSLSVDGPDEQEQEMVVRSNAMKSVWTYLLRAAATDSTILITGETGTGKELAAVTAHRNSSHSQGPFVCVNCAAIPESLFESEVFGYRKGAFTGALAAKKGRFELAAGGTLFLDEIGDMSLFSQAKILRALEEEKVYPLGAHKSVDIRVRIVAATNQEPEALIDNGRFRKDLYYRLNVARIHLPPLRERKEDIPFLADIAIRKLNRQYGRNVKSLSQEVLASFYHYPWPGNIRELNNIIEAAFISCATPTIVFKDLPRTFTKGLRYAGETPLHVRDKLLMTLAATDWNKSEAAKKLNWSRMRVYRTLKRFEITCPEKE